MDLDVERYIGHDVVLVITATGEEFRLGDVSDIEFRTRAVEMLDQCRAMMPSRAQDITIELGEDVQLQELQRYLFVRREEDFDDHPLGPMTMGDYRRWAMVPPPTRGPRPGKGQRKANRANRWR